MEFPIADGQSQADNCFLIARGDSISPHWLVYEVHRDFLSVPRTFAVLAIYSDYELEWQDTELTDDIDNALEAGIQRIAISTETDVPANLEHWRIYLPRLHVAMWGDIQLKAKIYGASSAAEALARVLNDEFTGVSSPLNSQV